MDNEDGLTAAAAAAVEEDLRRRLNGSSALILEDEPEFHEPMTAALRRFGFVRIEVCTTIAEASRAAAAERFDVLLVDRMVPDGDGLSLIERVRADPDAAKAQTSILFVTALADESSRVGGLLAGADDYVPKPANPLELIARIAAQLRRRAQARESDPVKSDGTIVNGPLRLSRATRSVTFHGEPVALTAQRFDILAVLMDNPGELMTHLMLFERCWPSWSILPEQWETNVYQAVTRVRKALAEGEEKLPPRLQPMIINQRGSGYTLRDLSELA